MSAIISKRINVRGYNIHYQEAGTGANVLLLFPGALGGAVIDYQLQLSHLSSDKIRVIAWDPPGLGQSIPPMRQFDPGYREKDASLAADLVKALGLTKVSVGGYSDGGTIALIMAFQHPDLVEKVITWGSKAYITREDFNVFEKLNEDTTRWNPKVLEVLYNFYGNDYATKTFSAFVDSYKKCLLDDNGDICTNILPHVKCLTMILHGVNDTMVPLEHPLYLRQHIPNSILVYLTDGRHSLQHGIYETFNKVVREFLLGKLTTDSTV